MSGKDEYTIKGAKKKKDRIHGEAKTHLQLATMSCTSQKETDVIIVKPDSYTAFLFV